MVKNVQATCPPGHLTARDTAIASLGPAKIPSPLHFGQFVADDARVQVYITPEDMVRSGGRPVYFEEAGPREKLYFDPSKTKCAVVTCGGLCPGLNDVIRAIVMDAHFNYKVSSVLGVRYGLQGFIPSYGHSLVELTPRTVSNIHEFGGTILASSRGPQEPSAIVDFLERMNISALFMIGGDGTMKAALSVVEEIKARNRRIAVIGIPKTIDNDIDFVPRSFGFDTAVDKACEAIRCAHVEAQGVPYGIGLVKLMGRESGYIAAQAALALKEVNYVLVPEDPFDLDGEMGFLAVLEKRLRARGHAVVVCAEGAGQDLVQAENAKDPSGNVVLGDIAGLLRRRIAEHFKDRLGITLKYIDPSYIIRSIPANSNDRIYCGFLGQNAVHAAMAGKTGMVVSRWNSHSVHIPMSLVTRQRKKINTQSNFWRAVLESTGQPRFLRNPA